MKKFVAVLALLWLPILANAEKVQIDGIWYNLIEKAKQAEVTSADDETKYTGEVSIPETVTYGDMVYEVTSIGEKAFSSCFDLTNVVLPNTITTIKAQAFYACMNLSEISIPDNVVSIGFYAFGYCYNLTGIVIPNSVSVIEGATFVDCSKLVDVIIPNSVTTIKYDAFGGCVSLTEIDIPESVISIEHDAFSMCSNLKNVTIPNSIRTIEGSTFNGCTSLTDIVIPDLVQTIHDYAFKGCNNLTTISIGKSVYNIGNQAFAGCVNLSNIYCYTENVPVANNKAFADSYIEYATLYVPDSSYYDYGEAEVWKDFGTITTLSGNIPAFTHSLIYMIDGVEYKRVEMDYKSVITLEDAPTREGYAFSGWSKVPATMPLHDVIVTGSFTPLTKCATPTINYQDGKLTFACEMEGTECVANIVCEDIQEHHGNEVQLTSTYQVTVYAKAEGYANSETATATLCWIECREEHEGEEGNEVMNIPSTPVLIQSGNGTLTVSGLTDGTVVSVYNISGMEVGSATTMKGMATIHTTLQAGDVAIVKVGAKSIKTVVK